jgi:ribosomal protein S4
MPHRKWRTDRQYNGHKEELKKLRTTNGTLSEQFQNPIETGVKHILLK